MFLQLLYNSVTLQPLFLNIFNNSSAGIVLRRPHAVSCVKSTVLCIHLILLLILAATWYMLHN